MWTPRVCPLVTTCLITSSLMAPGSGAGWLAGARMRLTVASSSSRKRCHCLWSRITGKKRTKVKIIHQESFNNFLSILRCNSNLKVALNNQRQGTGNRFQLHSSEVCAGGEIGKDACTGDGGSPLVCQSDTGRWTVVGLVTWGVGCGSDTPGVYANVGYFRNWINSNWGLCKSLSHRECNIWCQMLVSIYF